MKVRDLEAQLTTSTQQGQHFFKGFGNTYVFFSQSFSGLNLSFFSHTRHQSTSSFTDSVDAISSRALTPELDSSGRPLQYPLAILWTFEDCKKDPSIDFTAANEAHVALQKIIHHPNGTMTTHSAVKAITSRARPIVVKLLVRVPSHIQHKDIGKTYFQTTYSAEWDSACQDLETALPLLKLCSGHWKAEFVLAQVIQSIKRGKKSKATVSISHSTSPELDPSASDMNAAISEQPPDDGTISK
jgi:hypothetical protein